LLGPNGAGKSTTILMLLGLSEPDEGSIHVLGIDPTREPIPVKRKVGYLPDDVGFYEDRTGLENLVLTARLNQVPEAEAKERAYQLLESVGLQHAAHKKTGAYSRGMRQRLGLADVLIKAPEIIILDEPTLGIDPKGMDELLALIRSLSEEQGLTVLLSSHQLHQVQQICDRVGLFVRGRLLAEGDVASLSRSLFDDDPLQVTVECGPLNAQVLEQIRAIPGVRHAVPASGGNETDRLAAEAGAEFNGRTTITVGLDTDCSDAIARTIVESGVSLFGLQRKQYGLDEIYHRYFEGGEDREQGNSRSE